MDDRKDSLPREAPGAEAVPGPGLASPVSVLRGVVRERGLQLERLGLRTVGDLLLHGPRRYEDRRQFLAIRDVREGEPATVRGRVVAAGVNRFRSGKTVFQLVVDDGTSRLHCRWWNLPFLERLFSVGDDLLVFGHVHSLRPRTMDHPETEKVLSDGEESVHLNRWVPVYPSTEGLTQRALRSLIWQALGAFGDRVEEPHPDLELTDLELPASEGPDALALGVMLGRCPDRRTAIRQIHFPDDLAAAERARSRLALDEFVELQQGLRRRRRNLERQATALPCAGDNRWMRPFLAGLSFPLTGAQTRVLREIRAGLGGRVPMRRLLQGDVGSGKTLVAVCAALMTLESGYNVAVMAPTEILAGQLAGVFERALSPLGIAVVVHTGSRKQGDPTGDLLTGSAPTVVVGTQALVQGGFHMERLGLVIIDEQHKFGVAERDRLLRKGRYPHLLVMTATPIPRTLGLTVYGDLDVSVLDELPGGRRPIRTHVRTREALPKVWAFVRRELGRGRQAYLVYPRVAEAESADLKAVTRELEAVRQALAPHPVGMVHGRMSPEETAAVMSGFREGRILALLATSVVEVGVDVPKATVMLIENAERFGLAQLHQLRGRIGRGALESHCILLAGPGATPEGLERLRVVAGCADGFALAEEDLRLRGPGDLMGRDQSGVPRLRFGDLRRDRRLVELSRERVWRPSEPESGRP